MSTYGCYNRAAYPAYTQVPYAQPNMYGDGVFINYQRLELRNRPACQYTLTALGAADPKCLGCLWRKGQMSLKLWPVKDPNFR